jgi:hypothetical protein
MYVDWFNLDRSREVVDEGRTGLLTELEDTFKPQFMKIRTLRLIS